MLRTYYIVGTRLNGTRVVLDECRGQDRAEFLAAILRRHLEGYATIGPELAGGLAAGDLRRQEGCSQ